MHVWQQECMGLHAQEIMAMQEPQQTSMRTCTCPQAHLESYSTMFSQNIHELDSCICHWEKISQTTVKSKSDNAGHVK